MRLRDYINEDLVYLHAEAADKWAALQILLDGLFSRSPLKDNADGVNEAVRTAVLARERQHPTGLCDGLAFPHARVPGLETVAMACLTLKTPVDFGALDGRPADIVCLLVAPHEKPNLVLEIMAQLARLTQDAASWKAMLTAERPAEFLNVMERAASPSRIRLLARDLMVQPTLDVSPEMPIRKVLELMRAQRREVVEVVEWDGRLVGEITADALLKIGLPDFFSRLKSVAFLREFDPLEKYFANEMGMLARDVMSTTFCAVNEDATLMEVVFELAVHHHAEVYVVRDGKRIGMVDRIGIVNWILSA